MATFKNGTGSYSGDSGTQTIPHGLGVAPGRVTINAFMTDSQIGTGAISMGYYSIDGMSCSYLDINNVSGITSNYIIYLSLNTVAIYKATITVDATNLILDWTKIDGASTADFVWAVIE